MEGFEVAVIIVEGAGMVLELSRVGEGGLPRGVVALLEGGLDGFPIAAEAWVGDDLLFDDASVVGLYILGSRS